MGVTIEMVSRSFGGEISTGKAATLGATFPGARHRWPLWSPVAPATDAFARILNMLISPRAGLLATPILSRHIMHMKVDHHRLVQAVRTQSVWEEWIFHMLKTMTRAQTTFLEDIRTWTASMKKRICRTSIRMRGERKMDMNLPQGGVALFAFASPHSGAHLGASSIINSGGSDPPICPAP